MGVAILANSVLVGRLTRVVDYGLLIACVVVALRALAAGYSIDTRTTHGTGFAIHTAAMHRQSAQRTSKPRPGRGELAHVSDMS